MIPIIRKEIEVKVPLLSPIVIRVSGSMLLLVVGGVIIFLQGCLLVNINNPAPQIVYEYVHPPYTPDIYEDTICEEEIDTIVVESNRDMFIRIKHTFISQSLINAKVSRLDQLSNDQLLELNKNIRESFIQIILKNSNVPAHVYEYFVGTNDLNKIETSLMEQAKFHVPASIKLAQSALETAYGQRIVDNNYFGIKDKNRKSSLTTTTEYYTALEKQANKSIIISSKRVVKNGKTLYKCIVKDHFAEYNSPWHSFRSHSIFLSTNKRYSPLFTKGKNYEDWADKIGSTKYGGVGYATSPIYGELLKKIIKRYHLDLLDY